MYILYHGGFFTSTLKRKNCELAILDPGTSGQVDPKSADMKKAGSFGQFRSPLSFTSSQCPQAVLSSQTRDSTARRNPFATPPFWVEKAINNGSLFILFSIFRVIHIDICKIFKLYFLIENLIVFKFPCFQITKPPGFQG